jgi:hypothetical protein
MTLLFIVFLHASIPAVYRQSVLNKMTFSPSTVGLYQHGNTLDSFVTILPRGFLPLVATLSNALIVVAKCTSLGYVDPLFVNMPVCIQ